MSLVPRQSPPSRRVDRGRRHRRPGARGRRRRGAAQPAGVDSRRGPHAGRRSLTANWTASTADDGATIIGYQGGAPRTPAPTPAGTVGPGVLSGPVDARREGTVLLPRARAPERRSRRATGSTAQAAVRPHRADARRRLTGRHAQRRRLVPQPAARSRSRPAPTTVPDRRLHGRRGPASRARSRPGRGPSRSRTSPATPPPGRSPPSSTTPWPPPAAELIAPRNLVARGAARSAGSRRP